MKKENYTRNNTPRESEHLDVKHSECSQEDLVDMAAGQFAELLWQQVSAEKDKHQNKN